MKAQTHHIFSIGLALISIPIFASAWAAYLEYGALSAFRPWLIGTAFYEFGWEAFWDSLFMGIISALGLLALTLFMTEGMIFGVSASGLHGTAAWAKLREAKQSKVMSPWGVTLGRFSESVNSASNIMRTSSVDYSVMLLSAPPRSGKGVGVIIPTLLEYPGSFIVHDLKGEVCEATIRRRVQMGDKVRVFAPFDIHFENGMSLEGQSHGFNPLMVIKANPDLEKRITELDVLATSFLTTNNPREEGLLSSGREIFKAACAVACHEQDQPSIGSVVDLMTPALPKEGEVADYQLHLVELSKRAPDPLSRQALLTASSNKNENLSLYMAVLMDCGLKAWRDPSIRRATETNDFDFFSLRSEATAIYICIPTPFMETAAPVTRLFFQLAIRSLQLHLPDTEKEPFPVLFMLDEFPALGNMPEVLKAPAVIPGYAGRIMAVVQSPAKLDEIYGREKARVFLDLAGVKVFMTPNDNQTQMEIEKMLGYRSEVSKSVSGKGVAASSQTAGGTSSSYSEIKRPLMSADDIGRMPQDREIITIQGNKPVYGYRVRFYEDPHYKPLFEGQADVPWPFDEIPVTKSGPVLDMADFLKRPDGKAIQVMTTVAAPANDAGTPSEEAQTGADEETVEPEADAQPKEGEGADELAEDMSTDVEPSVEEVKAASDELTALFESAEIDMAALVALDQSVNNDPDSEVTKIAGRLSLHKALEASQETSEAELDEAASEFDWRADLRASLAN